QAGEVLTLARETLQLSACVSGREFQECGWRFQGWQLTGKVKRCVYVLPRGLDELEMEVDGALRSGDEQVSHRSSRFLGGRSHVLDECVRFIRALGRAVRHYAEPLYCGSKVKLQ